jgi:hypothetical protein
LAEIFFRRGYPSSVIEKGFRKALQLNRLDMLNSLPIQSQNSPGVRSSFFLSTTFLSDVNWGRVKNEVKCLRKLSGFTGNICFGFKNKRNLKSILIKSTLSSPSPISELRSIQCCGRKNCPILVNQKDFWQEEILINGLRARIPSNITCKSCNIVYYFFCIKCNKGYIGMTSRILSQRFSEHLAKIKNKPELVQTVHLHFHSCGIINARILPLATSSDRELPCLEKFFIKKYRPEFNVRDAKYRKVNNVYVLVVE